MQDEKPPHRVFLKHLYMSTTEHDMVEQMNYLNATEGLYNVYLVKRGQYDGNKHQRLPELPDGGPMPGSDRNPEWILPEWTGKVPLRSGLCSSSQDWQEVLCSAPGAAGAHSRVCRGQLAAAPPAIPGR